MDDHTFSVTLDDDDMFDCFPNFPEVDDEHPFALDYKEILTIQNDDLILQHQLRADPQHYQKKIMSFNIQLICYLGKPNTPWKICIPDAMLTSLVNFYHQALEHIGIMHLKDTIVLHFHHHNL